MYSARTMAQNYQIQYTRVRFVNESINLLNFNTDSLVDAKILSCAYLLNVIDIYYTLGVFQSLTIANLQFCLWLN